ncbi:hypothetical protein C8R47DRAFT_1231028 [Mycena vitilis]|nr:hypothetical protein C8R47DRAFT_1231028 [Mycena vitilis]
MRMKEEAANAHEMQMEQYEDILEGLPAMDKEGQEGARAQFSSVVLPLLEGLAAHTGLHAGVTASTPAELNFLRAEPEAYREVVSKFGCFVWDAYQYRTGGPRGGASTSNQAPTVAAPAPAAAALPRASSETVRPPLPPLAATAPPIPSTPPHIPNNLSWNSCPPHIPPHVGSPVIGGLAGAPSFANFSRSLASPGVQLHLDDGVFGGTEEFNFPEEMLPPPIDLTSLLTMFPETAAEAAAAAAVVDPFVSGFAGPVGPELRMLIDALAEDVREKRIIELRQMDADSLAQQNNTARNHFMMAGLGLGDAEKEMLWGGNDPGGQ